MKNLPTHSFLFALFFLLNTILYGQHAVLSKMNDIKSSGRQPEKKDLFQFMSADVHQRAFSLKGLKKGIILDINKDVLESLFQHPVDYIELPLPISERSTMVVTLQKNEIFTSGFVLRTSSDNIKEIPYTPGLHYIGVVNGDPSSLVAISIYHDEVMGMVATDEGNFVLGKIKGDASGRHVFYNDKDLDRPIDFDCQTKDEGLPYTEEQLHYQASQRDANDCVRVYVEIDDEIVADKGGAVPAANYITGLLNQSFVLYANESIHMMINEIFAWTTTSPYTGTGQQKLAAYQANTQFFNGDISHLIGYSTDGVAASLSGICNGNPDMSKCYSGIINFYWDVPMFSQSVEFVTHEMGHLLGSHHTHACVWNGNNTAIDGCGTVEGSCPQPPLPPNNTGTIMSYCWTTGFDFNLGFGPQPGNVIRSVVNTAGNCLFACGPATHYCVSYGNAGNNKYIKQVVLGSINNLSNSNNGYGNYLSKSTNLTAGNTYTISLTPGNNGSTKYWRVWIDYNGDNDWNDAGEQVGQKTGTQVVSIPFTVPAGTPAVSTRMRVSMSYDAYVSSCAVFNAGEVEDYTVNILTPPGGNRSELHYYYIDYDQDGTLNPYITIQAETMPLGWGGPDIDPYTIDLSSTCNGNGEFIWDCDDTDNQITCAWSPCINFGSYEVCNGIDDDGDGLIDADDPDVVAIPWYADADADGFGDLNVSVISCSQPGGYVPWPNFGDCDDSDPNVHPGATETCDGIDNNCDGLIEQELCNGLDDDCDGLIDEEVADITWFLDWDHDGYGSPTSTTISCNPPYGYVLNNTDCYDYNPSIHPGALDYCNGYDDNCDGTIDEGPVWYLDGDGDGFGNPEVVYLSCYRPSGYVGTGTDCDDAHGNSNPDASEILDGLDNDCDGLIDEGLSVLNVEAGDCEVVYYGYAPEACQVLSVTASGGATPYTYHWSNGANTQTTSVCPSTTTIYAVTVTDHNGVTAEDNVTVQVVDVRCGNNNNKVTLCHSQQTLCVAQSAVAAHLSHGDVLGVCNAENPCPEENESSAGFKQIQSPMEIAGQSAAKENNGISDINDFTLVPNPANDEVTLNTNVGHAIFTLVDLSGNELVEQQTQHGNVIINTSTIASGMYFIRMQTGTEVRVKMLMVVH